MMTVMMTVMMTMEMMVMIVLMMMMMMIQLFHELRARDRLKKVIALRSHLTMGGVWDSFMKLSFNGRDLE